MHVSALYRRYRRVLKILSAYNGVVISIASLIVSISALWVSIETQKLDLKYKELTVRPYLWIKTEKPFKISLRNDGLGPAKVHNLRWRVDDDHVDLQDARSRLPEIMRKQVEKCALRNIQLKYTGLFLSDLFRYVSANQEATFVSIYDHGLSSDSPANLSDEFSDCSLNLDLQVCYCSLSRLSCGVTVTATNKRDPDFRCPAGLFSID